jgi:hypothetical protein
MPLLPAESEKVIDKRKGCEKVQPQPYSRQKEYRKEKKKAKQRNAYSPHSDAFGIAGRRRLRIRHQPKPAAELTHAAGILPD